MPTVGIDSGQIQSVRQVNEPMAELEFLWLEITNRCNLQCIHCYAESAPNQPLSEGMQFEDWLKLIREGASLGCRKVQFIGGEPTVHPRLLDLIDYARIQNFEFIEIYTNGTRLSENLCQEFRLRNVHLAVSVYGAAGPVHDKVTLRSGSFQKTIEGVKRALTHGIPVRVGIIEMPENEGTIDASIALLREIGVKSIQVDRLRGIGRGGNEIDPFKELCGNCWRGSLAINASGDISPCIFSHFNSVGHADMGLKAVLENEALTTFRSRMMARSANDEPSKGCDPNFCSPCAPDANCNPWCNPGCNPGRN
jgi:MoaA/NifB/PqqE/SkfB family radical SAM enzyme